MTRLMKNPNWGRCPICGVVIAWPGNNVRCDECDDPDAIFESITDEEAKEAGAA